MLELSSLTKEYGGFGFGPVDLTVDEEVLAVLGPSGSGKTTLLSTVAGIVEPDSGGVRLDGRELVGRPPEARGTGLVFQDGALFPHMTARENVAYAATAPERVTDLASLFEIGDVLDRRPGALSGGERQRVALARTLAADPDALLLDEPLSSLDAPIRRRLRLDLHDLFDSLSIPVIYVTHDQRTASALGDRIAVLRDGSVEQVGPAAAVLERPGTRFVARFTGSENVLDATVADVGRETVGLRVGPGLLRASRDDGAAEPAVGDAVTVTVHPSRVEVTDPEGGSSADGGGSPTGLAGTVTRLVDEGDRVRVVVRLGPAGGDGDDPVSVTATALPPTVDRLGLAEGDRVGLSVSPDDVHRLP